MASKELVETLEKMMDIGIWESKSSLMEDVLRVFPDSFRALSNEDAIKVINYGNEVFIHRGEPPISIGSSDLPFSYHSPKADIFEAGKCVDLWKDDSPRRFTKATKSKRFGDYSYSMEYRIKIPTEAYVTPEWHIDPPEDPDTSSNN